MGKYSNNLAYKTRNQPKGKPAEAKASEPAISKPAKRKTYRRRTREVSES